MQTTIYSGIIREIEEMAREATETAAQYADGEEWSESQYHDGRAAGIREVLAKLQKLDLSDDYRPMDTRDYMGRA